MEELKQKFVEVLEELKGEISSSDIEDSFISALQNTFVKNGDVECLSLFAKYNARKEGIV